ncbi:MAG: hypothetical protein UY48_C0044G0004 [Candidatus Gottesmanbacteria bacterium GW2011_GWB1_49_7]|uniref:Uncharacterized protein n=1 Tax=Candidatus Gottesmanbacteria bacterium GW2011_GWB1_49_7 TaxID=1618448 RepID=A0A0G1VV98_9BACT|nr:MAG: hypothetical protein UY48_C0044G0004 [Candidatus Gottesmanbacteria bacterium GW2011_GWB1_49_7]
MGIWESFKAWVLGTSVEAVAEDVAIVPDPDYWGTAEFEVMTDECNGDCRVLDIKLTGEIRGKTCELTQRVVFPTSIMGAKENYNMLAETLNNNVLYPWVNDIIRKQDEAVAEAKVP